MKIRIKFAKYGAMKFIGHLDIMRYFQKAVRRADIDIRYSEGFSPHQIMSFAAPLGVGIESYGEYMDIEVLSMTSAEEMKFALNCVMADGVEILSVNIMPDNVKNAMASVAAASYRIRRKREDARTVIRGRGEDVCGDTAERFPIADLTGTLQAFLAQEHIPYAKETKKSVLELDLKPGIYELTAASGSNIKPMTVMERIFAFAGTEIPQEACQVTRLETYADLAKAGEAHRFVPLADVGKDG